MTNKVWKLRGIFPQDAPLFPEIPSFIQQVLHSRDINSREEMDKHFSASLKELKNPFVLKDMDLACERLMEARNKNEKICVYADFDLDGTSGLALMYEGLKRLAFHNVSYYQPRRLSEGYGVHEHAIDLLAAQGVKVLITVDVGITAIEEVKKAKELGMEVVITDHHLPKETLPPAFAIINPNQKECASKLGHLSGVGVAFYFILALRRRLLDAKKLGSDFDPKDLLDCFVVGTLSDMVPLIEENRSLVKHGLITLQNTKRPGLKKLLEHLKMQRVLSAQDVAIGFVPKLNALSRMEMSVLPIDLFLVDGDQEASHLIVEVMKNNEMRKDLQSKAETSALDRARSSQNSKFAWVTSKEYHKGVVGLVATKLCQTLAVPAFVGSEDENGKIVGSARLPDNSQYNLTEILGHASGILERFGGHAVAAGFALPKENAKLFEERLCHYFENFSHQVVAQELYYDAQAKITDLNQSAMTWLEKIGPFGASFPVPNFLIQNCLVQHIYWLKGGHLKLKLKDPHMEEGMIEALYFSPPVQLKGIETGSFVDVIGEAQWNYFNGRRQVQILLKDLKRK